MTWQPISTAPKDGTWVLLAGGTCHQEYHGDDNRPVVGQWTDYLNGRTSPKYERWQFAWYEGGYDGTYDNPTHWMPLPPPPPL